MILVDWQIKELIENTGCIEPFNPNLLNGLSLDVCLGDEIKVEGVNGFSPLNISENGYFLTPNQFILACTKEVFNLPDNISCEFALKSSLARQGLGHSLAVFAFAGFSNSVLTLELKNYTRYHFIPLFAGMRIGQLIFHSHESCSVSYQLTGRYNGDRTVQQSKG